MGGKIVPADSAGEFELITPFDRIENVWRKAPGDGVADQPRVGGCCHEWPVGIGRKKRHRRHARTVVKLRSGAFPSTFDTRNHGVGNFSGREYSGPLGLIPGHGLDAIAAPDVEVHRYL